jgi:lipopolysaccharide/colanic/teichoic acid biosynthesis glycosyltransferase
MSTLESEVLSVPVVSVGAGALRVHPGVGWETFCSRLLDLCVATLAGILVLPVVVVALIAIKLVDRGPGFYAQERQGKDGKPFKFNKLRTMRMHSDVWLREYLANHPDAPDPRIYRNANDPRLLPVVGRLLRRYSIDELPQIWSVVRGDMSLVGPRALPAYHCQLLRPEFLAFRSRVRPGITGLWQVEGRSNADPSSLERYDSQYLNHWSLGADLRILCRTVVCVLRGSGL